MKTTIDFYVDVLGMPLVHVLTVREGLGSGPNNRGNPPFERIRHYFFAMGNDCLLAFFEMPKGEKPRSDRDAIGGMQHVAFTVAPRVFEGIQDRLTGAGVSLLGPIAILKTSKSIYFFDPNGIRLEATCLPATGDANGVAASAAQRRADARSELETIEGADRVWIEQRLLAFEE
ncbi:MAG: VOC family protein [Alphaproteobacteria bacterium]